jgi:hypothetical protein
MPEQSKCEISNLCASPMPFFPRWVVVALSTARNSTRQRQAKLYRALVAVSAETRILGRRNEGLIFQHACIFAPCPQSILLFPPDGHGNVLFSLDGLRADIALRVTPTPHSIRGRGNQERRPALRNQVIVHVCEHESHHAGQIDMLKKRLPGAKPDAE